MKEHNVLLPTMPVNVAGKMSSYKSQQNTCVGSQHHTAFLIFPFWHIPSYRPSKLAAYLFDMNMKQCHLECGIIRCPFIESCLCAMPVSRGVRSSWLVLGYLCSVNYLSLRFPHPSVMTALIRAVTEWLRYSTLSVKARMYKHSFNDL